MIRHKLQTAIENRQDLLTEVTNALRLIDGGGDGLPDLFLDSYAGRWLVSTRSDLLDSEIRDWLEEQGRQGRTSYWKQLDQHEKTDPTHIAGPEQSEPFLARENGVDYKIHFKAGYSQGIFLDQRLNRQRVRQFSGEGKTVLNTFAYTGAFSVSAALNGATTTTLDLSQIYLDWAKENFRANGMSADDHYFCKGDTFHWLNRFKKQGRSFDGIILDPPTFSRDDKGKVFRVEKDYGRLVSLAYACLTKGGWILCCTNCRKLDPRDFTRMVREGARGAKVSSLNMPPEYSGEHYLKSLWVQK